jgi:membrane carboxypeptidase/penicillin-binding protein
MQTGETGIKLTLKNPSTAQLIKFWNGTYELTAKEVVILAGLIDAPGKLCSAENRTYAHRNLGISKMSLNTYIKRLKDKKALIQNGNKEYAVAKLFEKRHSVEVRVSWAS